MTEVSSSGRKRPAPSFLGPATLGAAVFIFILALAAVLWPPGRRAPAEGRLLVLDPLGGTRGEVAFAPLARWLAAGSGRALQLEIATSLAELTDRSFTGVDLVLCPDAVALGLPRRLFTSLAAGRRHTPHNLRPRSVLVYRTAGGRIQQPWFRAPERTILGDSLSLAGFGVICAQGIPLAGENAFERWRGRWTFGPDPYDHRPALHALRLGCFDFAVVREIAAESFFEGGLLDPEVWSVDDLTGKLPDVVVMVARNCPPVVQVRLGEILMGLGRHPDNTTPAEEEVLAGLALVGLDGFNLLLPPDFDQIRRRFDRCWPRQGE